MKSKATTVEGYLEGLEPDRLEAITAVRATILENLPEGFEETIRWGMLSYEVPLSTCPETYNGQPLSYAGLASQKRHMAIYLSGMYMDQDKCDRFVTEWKSRGTRLDMGKSCVRFRKLEEVELDLVGGAIAAFSVDEFVGLHQQVHRKE